MFGHLINSATVGVKSFLCPAEILDFIGLANYAKDSIKKHEVLLKIEKTQLLKLLNLKQGLMADLLTGRVRVQVAEEAAAEMAEVYNG